MSAEGELHVRQGLLPPLNINDSVCEENTVDIRQVAGFLNKTD